MKNLIRSGNLLLALLPSACLVRAQAPDAMVSASSERAALTAMIRAQDNVIFTAIFDTCDMNAAANLVTDDLEFYHDQWGRIAANKAKFLHVIERQCNGWKKPGALRSRRVLDEKTLLVYPIPGFGASETGTHRFYELEPDGSQKLVGIAQFTMVWRKEGTDWHLSRVVSYAHQDF